MPRRYGLVAHARRERRTRWRARYSLGWVALTIVCQVVSLAILIAACSMVFA